MQQSRSFWSAAIVVFAFALFFAFPSLAQNCQPDVVIGPAPGVEPTLAMVDPNPPAPLGALPATTFRLRPWTPEAPVMLLLSCAALSERAIAQAELPQYIVVDIGAGGARAISDSGPIVGGVSLIIAHFWELQKGTWTWVCCPQEPHVWQYAYAVNDAGVAAGTYTYTFAGMFAAVWDDFTQPPEFIDSGEAYDINNAGDLAGRWPGGALNTYPVIWRDGERIQLSEFSGAATALNDQGHVVGIIATPPVATAVLWEFSDTRPVMTELGIEWLPNDVNNHTEVVGRGQTAESLMHAFLWREGILLDLGTLGGEESEALSINNAGDIVGTSDIPDGGSRAFFYRDGVMHDLNDLVVGGAPLLLTGARGINDRGYIVGGGLHPDGEWASFVAVPVVTGDLNTDGFVDANDLAILLGAWSLPPGSPGCAGAQPCASDLNDDGLVNAADLAVLLGAWTL